MIGVHGFAGDKDSSMLEKLADSFCLHNRAIITFDFPAHGSSYVGEEMLTIHNCKKDLCTVVAKFIECGFERPINLPYSFYENLMNQEVIGSKHISLPTLIIHGDRDDIVPLLDIKTFSMSQNNVSLKIISGADHRFKNDGEMQTIVDMTKTFLNI